MTRKSARSQPPKTHACIHQRPRYLIVLWLCAAVLLVISAAEVSAAEFTVTNTNDSGAGSLRQAILDSNAFPTSAHDNAVIFNIPGSGVHSIRPASPLPPIKDLLIDGYTQPGSRPNTLSVGSDAVLTIELDGSAAGAGADGLVNLGAVPGAGTPTVTVRGLVINRFGGRGIHVTGPGGSGFPGFARVQGCYIGTDASGTQALGNGVGIELGTDGQAVIGEPTPDFGGNTPPFPNRNLISGNLGAGVKIDSTDPLSPAVATLRGAYVGTNASGTMALGNGGDGVQIGPEGGAGSGVLTFTPGQITRTVTTTINGDNAVEPNETFLVNLSISGGATIADAQGRATIVDDDTLASCEGFAVTMLGTAGNDRLLGNDIIDGLGGNDVICGGAGNDSLVGGTGQDRLNGGSGGDNLLGSAGDDRLNAGIGDDRLSGGPGADDLTGGGGHDRLDGGSGNDNLQDRDGRRDHMNGGAGRDRCLADRVDVVSRNCERITRGR